MYTHVSGHYGPFYTRVISATMSEAPYVCFHVLADQALGHLIADQHDPLAVVG
jgi:hypothetical protein